MKVRLSRLLRIFSGNKHLIFSGISERIFFFLIFLIIARNYSAKQYGEIITVFSLANIFIIFFDFGLPVLLQKEVSLFGKKASGFLNNVLLINIVFFPFYIFSVFFYCIIFYQSIQTNLIIIISLTVYLFSLGNIFSKALSGLKLFKSLFFSLLVSRLYTLILIISALLISDPGMNEIFLITMSGSAVQLAILFYYTSKNKLISFKYFFDLKKSIILLKSASPLGLAVIFNFLYDKIDIIIISKLTDFDQVAFYNIGYGIYKTSSLAYSFIFISGFTRISYIAGNKKAVSLFFKKYFSVLSAICLVIAIILFAVPDILVKLIYTDKMAEASPVLRILAFAVFGLAFNNLTGIMLNGLGMYKKNMYIALTGLLLNIILNIIFIPEYGILAAATVTVVTEYYIFITGYLLISKHI